MVSVDGIHDRLTRLDDTGTPARPVGTDGGVVSTIQWAVAGVGSVPVALVAATAKVWRPPVRPAYVTGLAHAVAGPPSSEHRKPAPPGVDWNEKVAWVEVTA